MSLSQNRCTLLRDMLYPRAHCGAPIPHSFRKEPTLRRAILSALVIIAAAPHASQAQIPESPQRNDYPFQCGATFAILAKAHEEIGDTVKSVFYQTKFDKLALEAEMVFKRLGRTKAEAEEYMQKHVDTLVRLAGQDERQLANFSRLCNELFPS
jgi:hypothetical protein